MKLSEVRPERKRKVKIWNGTARRPKSRDYVSVYVGAYSMKHAAELLTENGFGWHTASTIKNWFSPTWGNPMKGIEPEVGIWITAGSGPPGIPQRIV